MDLHETTPDEHDEVIDLVVGLCPGVNRALVEAPVREAAATQNRSMLSVTDQGRVVGLGLQFHGAGLPDGVYLEIVAITPDHRDRGVGGRLHRALGADLPRSATSVVAQVEDTDDRSLAIAHGWGFTTMQHSISSRLELSGPTTPDLPAGVSAEVNPPLVFADEDAVEAMFDASQTNPEREYEGPTTLAHLRSFASGEGGVQPVAVVLRDGARPVAISYAIVHGDLAQVVYTGVDPADRGRRLGALAKQVLHVEAAKAGAAYAVTDNEAHNTGIRHLNEELGYVRTTGNYWVRRKPAQLQPEVDPQPSQT